MLLSTALLPMTLTLTGYASERDAGDVAIDHLRVLLDGSPLHHEVERVAPWAGGTVVRVRHTLQGLPVANRGSVVQLDGAGAVRRSRGARPIRGEIDRRPTLTESQAIARTGPVLPYLGQGTLWTPRTALQVFVDRQDQAHLAWAVDVGTRSPVATWRIFVDAHDGRILSNVRTSYDARGNVYPSNPDASDLVEVDLPRLVSETELDGEYAWVNSCDEWSDGGMFGGGTCEAKSFHALPDANGDYLFDPDPGSDDDPLAEVQMYYHLDLVSEWFETALGFTRPDPIEGVVNFDMSNAFFGDADGDGESEVAFGQAGNMDFAYDADVIYHEFTHAVIGQITSMGFFGADEYGITFAPLALNEGSADLFSMVLTLDPALGEYAGGAFGNGPIRDMDPDRRCPHDLYGESHEDGMIWGAMGWNMIDDPAVGPEIAAQLFYASVLTWPSDVNWAIAGDSLVDAAADMLGDGAIDQAAHDAIVGHVQAAGAAGCERVIPLDDGTTSTQLALYIGLADAVGHVPLTSQFSLDAPEGTGSLKLKVDQWAGQGAGDVGWTAFVRRGKPVRYGVIDIMGFEVPEVDKFDFKVDGEGTGRVVIDFESENPIEPGDTYYFSVAARNLGGVGPMDFATIEASISGTTAAGEPPVDDDAVADATSEEGGGCGCTVAGSGAGGALVITLAAILGLRRRRGVA